MGTGGTTAIVLAGGKGRRFGAPKAALSFKDAPLLPQLVDRLRPVADSVVVAGHPSPPPWIPEGIRFVADGTPGGGPLLAFGCALRGCSEGVALLVGCDMPFVSAELLSFEASILGGFDAVLPVFDDHDQPLHAAYSTRVLLAIEECGGRGESSMRSLIAELRVRRLRQDEWSRFSPEGRCFYGINTPEDLSFRESLL